MAATYTPRAPRAPKLTVNVTAEHIERSMKRNSSHCMIAEAVLTAFPKARSVAVDLQSIRFTDPVRGLRFVYFTPRIGQLALLDFDQGVKPKPLSFVLVKGAVRRAAPRPSGDLLTIPTLDRRVAIVGKLIAKRINDQLTLAEIGDATDIAPRTLEQYVSANPPRFTEMVARKLEAWLEGRPVPGRKGKIPPSLVGGNARFRVPKPGGRERDEVVGGKSPPVGNVALRREFGLRTMVR